MHVLPISLLPLQTPDRHARYLFWRDHRDETPALLRRRLRAAAAALWRCLTVLYAILSRRDPNEPAVPTAADSSCPQSESFRAGRGPVAEMQATAVPSDCGACIEGSFGSTEGAGKHKGVGFGDDAEAEFLLSQYRSSMVRARPETDHELLEEAVRYASGGSVWDTSKPFVAALCKPYFVRALSGIAIALLASWTQCILQVAVADL
jgi:hypothetical protein